VLGQLPEGQHRPLFAREAGFTLGRARPGTADVLASSSGAGENAIAALSAALTRTDALGVLAALDGEQSELAVGVRVTYRTAPAARIVRLTGSWSEVFDATARAADVDDTIGYGELQERFQAMLAEGVIRAGDPTRLDPATVEDSVPLFVAFLGSAALILDRLTPELLRDDPANRFRLRARPNPAMPLAIRSTVVSAEDRSLELDAALEDVIGGCLSRVDRERFIRLVAFGDDNGPGAAPRLVTRTRAHARGTRNVGMAVLGGSMRSLALVGTPDARAAPTAHGILASDLVGRRLSVLGPIATWEANDLVVVLPHDGIEPPSQPLPTVDDPSAPLWPDRADPGRRWYPPSFELLRPAPSADPVSSPFLFTFLQRGVTAGPNPSPGLEGTITFTLRPGMGQATRDALAALGNPPASALPLGNLSVALELPFKEQGTGITKMQVLPAEVQAIGGDLVATVGLLDEWVRLAYGALAYEGFQVEPPRLRAVYAFSGYRPVDLGIMLPVFGGKIAAASILRLTAERRGPPRTTRSLPALATAMVVADVVTTPHLALIAAPALQVAPTVITAGERASYAIQTLVREEQVTALFRCAELGAFYRRVAGDGTTAIVGCQDALRLGEVEYRQYEELPQHRTSSYRVLRSLQQPGRFLVVPATYRITRYGPEEPSTNAYRPVVAIYAVLGSSAGDARYVLTATLQPDIPPFARRDLAERLRLLTPQGTEPILDFPTEPAVQAQVTYRWAKPDTVVEPVVLLGWDGFRVSVSTGLRDALLLTTIMETSGLAGEVTFKLRDGQRVSSAIVLDTTVVGPWTSGPVEVAVSDAAIRLTDRCERTVNVSDLVLEDPGGTVRRMPVEVALNPGASIEIATVAGRATVYPVYSLAPGPLELQELNCFVEDVEVSLVFVNLVNFANHNLASMEVGARLQGAEHIETTALAEGTTASIDLTLPLTSYLQEQVVEYRVTKTQTDGETETTPWRAWNLETGTVISIAWEVIA
jgi:hypothetical protein